MTVSELVNTSIYVLVKKRYGTGRVKLVLWSFFIIKCVKRLLIFVYQLMYSNSNLKCGQPYTYGIQMRGVTIYGKLVFGARIKRVRARGNKGSFC